MIKTFNARHLGKGLAALACLTAGLCVGCGNGLHEVTGVVLVDGKPAASGVQVLFLPESNARVATGSVGADGSFIMQTDQKTGVMPGDYIVTLVNSKDSPVNGTFATDSGLTDCS
jgi:hypothetical protein